jgi:hypothetical protein
VRRAPPVRELAVGLLRRFAAWSTRLADRLSPPVAASDAPAEWLAMVAARQPSFVPLLRGSSGVPAGFDHSFPEVVATIGVARPASAPSPRAVARPVVAPLPDADPRPVVTLLPDAVARPRVAPSHARSALSPDRVTPSASRVTASPDRVTASPDRVTASPDRAAPTRSGRVVPRPAPPAAPPPFLPLLRGSSGQNEPRNHYFPEGVAKEGRWPTLLNEDPLWTGTTPAGRTDGLDAEQRGEPWTA